MEYRKCSADVDEAKLKQVEEHLHEFTHKMDTAMILLQVKHCLMHVEFIEVQHVIERGNKLKANQLLWKYLKRAANWWQYLEEALKKCGYPDLLQIMQSVDS